MKKHLSQILILASILAFLDQLTKYFAFTNLKTGPINIIGQTIQFQYSENIGIAFGIPIPPIVMIFATIIIIPLIIFLATKEFKIQHRLSKISLALILGGALGNLIDRFTHGFVIDFIKISIWPNFNLADVYIVTGILLILVFYAKIKRVYGRK